MKAAYQLRYGGADVVEVREITRPTPAAGEILVRVKAAATNRADLDGLKPRPKFSRLFTGIRAPRIRAVGIDVAGIVEAVGEGVTRFKVGDAVFADLFGNRHGAFAEYTVAPEKKFQHMPEVLSFEEAACLPHSAVLAVQGLRLRNGRTPKAGDRVLIDGASGNVGPFAVQIAKAMGCEVTGTTRAEKLDFVRALGADHVIDYTRVDYTKAGVRYDWIVDTDSHHSLRSVRRALTRRGAYVTLGGGDRAIFMGLIVGPLISLVTRKWSGLMLWWKPFHPPDVERLTQLIAAGSLRPSIDRRFPLEQVADALAWVEAGHARGKVVIEVDPTP